MQADPREAVTMMDAQLRHYLDRRVQLQFVDGMQVTGRLIEGEPVYARGDAYSIITREASATEGLEFIGIRYASLIKRVTVRA